MEGGGGGGSIFTVFLWEPREIVIFQVGSGNTIPSLDARMGRWGQTDTIYDYFLSGYFTEGVTCVRTLQGFCLIDSS